MRLISGIPPQDDTSLGCTNWSRVHVMYHNLDGLAVEGGLSAWGLKVFECGRLVRVGVEDGRRNRTAVLQGGYVRSEKNQSIIDMYV